MALCNGEPDNSAEVQEKDGFCFACTENVVPDMIHFTRCKKYDVSTMQEICLKIVLNSLKLPCIPTFLFMFVAHKRQSSLCLLLTHFKFMLKFKVE